MFRFDLLRRVQPLLPVTLAALVIGAVWGYEKSHDIVLSSVLVFISVFVGALPFPARRDGGRPGVFVARTLGLVGLLLAGVMVFNYVFNPLGIYPTSYFEPLVLDHDTTFRYKMNLYDNMNPPPDVVVLGSSRSFTVPPAYITQVTGLSAFNASIHGGTFSDMIQFTRHMVDEGHPPRVIIIGLPTELIVHKGKQTKPDKEPAETSANPKKKKAPANTSLVERLLGADTYRHLDEFRADLSYNIDLTRQLVSWYQTKESIRQLELEFEGRPQAYYRFDQDGLAHFNIKRKLSRMVQDSIANPLWGNLFAKADTINKGTPAALKNLLTLCRKNHIQVIFYLPPYHPQMLAVYEQQNFPRLKAEQLDLLASMQDKYDFTVHDMTSVESFGGDETMFVDGVHPNEDAGRLILDVLLKDIPQE